MYLTTAGTLKPHPTNSRYFTDNSGKAIWLTGSHTWATLQERRLPETPELDYDQYLDWMVSLGHNFLRMWTWEHATWMQFTPGRLVYYPTIYQRTGPGKALDGEPKFDLTKLNPEWFDRLRARVEKAGRKGIYVSVMFFQGFSLCKNGGSPYKHLAYKGHPFHKENNINGIDGSPDGSGTGEQVHTLDVPAITELQKRFITKVIDTVGDFDHVLWEIANEAHAGSVDWQYHLIDFVHKIESNRPKQHPVGMTGAPITTDQCMASNADWISPSHDKGFRSAPPIADGRKVIIADTDHFAPWDAFMDPALPWRMLTRGHNFILMDPYMDARFGSPRVPVLDWNPIRAQMGHALRLSRLVDLATALPHPELCSAGHCLANPGHEYLAYQPTGPSLTLDLGAAKGMLSVTWLNEATGELVDGGDIEGGATREMRIPFWGGAGVVVKA
ncbi:MAG: hypothetical protein GF331_27100 [Chitinivibrionales bacterium]|nr:hypothetical protein [Chitinivibrionales bacterium]